MTGHQGSSLSPRDLPPMDSSAGLKPSLWGGGVPPPWLLAQSRNLSVSSGPGTAQGATTPRQSTGLGAGTSSERK